ncbi:MAG: hypothetical protein HC802_09445 [Caldilineaceae bacterium]|nr:hypothetical protein [Caldilineaceae bacterium]
MEELESRGLFRLRGRLETEPESFGQSVDDYIESAHARNGFSRDRMTPQAAADFDEDVRSLIAHHGRELVTLQITGTVNWGDPLKRMID